MVDQVLHDLHLVLSLAVGLEEAGSEEQRQVLSAHLVQVSTLLDPEGDTGPGSSTGLHQAGFSRV